MNEPKTKSGKVKYTKGKLKSLWSLGDSITQLLITGVILIGMSAIAVVVILMTHLVMYTADRILEWF